MIRATIVTISDSCSAGTQEDFSGPALASKIAEQGWTVARRYLLPDEKDQIARLWTELAHSGEVDLIVATGGTGLAPRDVTPEATESMADREVPGFGELMRSVGLQSTKFAPLSRSGAWTSKATLILNLPGSPKGAVDSLLAVAHLVPHAVDLLQGRTKH